MAAPAHLRRAGARLACRVCAARLSGTSSQFPVESGKVQGWPGQFSRESGPSGGRSAALQLSGWLACRKLAVRRVATRRLRTLHAVDEIPGASGRASRGASGRAGGEGVRAGAHGARPVCKDFAMAGARDPDPKPSLLAYPCDLSDVPHLLVAARLPRDNFRLNRNSLNFFKPGYLFSMRCTEPS